MSRNGFGLDERNRAILGRICTILYILTIYFLVGDILYRQIVLHQTPGQFEDIAALMTVNVFAFIGLMLFFGGVSIGRFSFTKLFAGYLGFLALGMGYIAVKYWGRPTEFLIDKAVTVFTICTIIVALASLVGYFGNRKIERDIE